MGDPVQQQEQAAGEAPAADAATEQVGLGRKQYVRMSYSVRAADTK